MNAHRVFYQLLILSNNNSCLAVLLDKLVKAALTNTFILPMNEMTVMWKGLHIPLESFKRILHMVDHFSTNLMSLFSVISKSVDTHSIPSTLKPITTFLSNILLSSLPQHSKSISQTKEN